jgi:integrase
MKHRPTSRRSRSSTRSVLRLLDLEHSKTAVLNNLTSQDAQRGYRHAIDEFVDWYCSEPRLAFNRIVVLRYRTLDHLQQREEHWAIVDLMGKRGHVRTVPVPEWVKSELGVWLAAAGIDRGRLFRRVNKVGKTWGEGMTVKAVWHIVKESAKCIGVPKLAPHDLRRYADSAMLRAGSWSRSNSLWARLSSNHRTVPWVHAANSLSRQ